MNTDVSTPIYYEQYEQHRTFTDISELNENVRRHLYYNAHDLNKSDKATFKLLSRFSCVVPGVSWMKVATMAGRLDKAEKTVRRALRKLENLGMIRRVPTIREKGGRGHDICIILNESINEASVQADCPRDEQPQSPRESKAEKGSEQKETAIYKQNTYVKGTYLPDYIPASFARLCAGLGNDKLTVKLWHKVTLAHGHSTLNGRIEDVLDTVNRTLKGALYKAKHGQIKRTLAGYFYRGLYQRLIEEKRREVIAGMTYNWLDEEAT